MSRAIKQFFYRDNGTISIEFAVIFPLFLSLFLFTLEFSRMMFIGSSLDLMSTQIGRKSMLDENSNIDYSIEFNRILGEEIPLWPFLTTTNDFHVTVKFCQTIDDVIEDRCDFSSSVHDRIVFYTIEYRYYAAFTQFFSRFFDSSLTKKIVMYREFK